MQEKVEVKEHAENIVNAIQALMPSRNYIVQFLAVSSTDFPTMYDVFPELLRDEKNRTALEMAFGVSFGERVEVRDYEKLGNIFIDFYSKIFKALEKEDVAQGLAQLMETDKKNIPAPRKEWLELRLRGLAMEPNYGKEAVNVLQTIKKIGEEKDKRYPTYEASSARIAGMGGVTESRIHYVIDLLLKYKLVEKINVAEEGQKKEGIRFGDSLKDHADMIDTVFK